MTIDRTPTAITLLTAMHQLRDHPNEELEVWGRLEAEVLSLLGACDSEALITCNMTYLAGSAAVLRALPRRGKFKTIFDSEIERGIRTTIPIDAFGAAIEQQFLRPNQACRLLAHRPGDADWTRYLCEVLSPLHPFLQNGMWSLWTGLRIPEPVDYARIEKVLHAQVRDHPHRMQVDLADCVTGRDSELRTAAALLLSGVIFPEWAKVSTMQNAQSKAFAQNAITNHGRMSIRSEYGPVSRAVREIVEIDSATNQDAR